MNILERKNILKIFMLTVIFFGGIFTTSLGAEIEMTWWAETHTVKHMAAFSNGVINIDWGDGVVENKNGGYLYHYYNKPGKYDVTIEGEITSFECNREMVTSLKCTSEILNRLECENNSLKSLDLVSLPRLQELYVSENILDSLNISNNLDLRRLNISDNNIFRIDLSKNVNLETVTLDNNKLERVSINGLKNLKSISLQKNRLSYFETVGNDSLNSIFCKNNFIENIKLGDNNQVSFLDCSNNKIKVLDISKSKNMKILKCESENLEAIVLDNDQESTISLIKKMDKTKKIKLKQVKGAKILHINNFNFYVGTEKDVKIEKILIDGRDIGHKNEITLSDDDLEHTITVKVIGGISDANLAVLEYPLENVYKIGDTLYFGGASCVKEGEFTPISINISGMTIKQNGTIVNNITFTPKEEKWGVGGLEIVDFNGSQFDPNRGTHFGTIYISCCSECGGKTYNIYAESMESLNSFKIISIRDVRWENYFVNGKQETGKYFSIPATDKQMISVSQNNPIKLGYAVEFKLETQSIPQDNAVLVIKPKIINKANGSIVKFSDITDKLANQEMDSTYLKKNNFNEIKIYANNKYKDTMFQTNVKHKSDSNNSMEWSWLYYLPASIDFNNAGNEICIKFDIELYETTDGKTISDANKKFSICKYVQTASNSTWNGKVFDYSLTHTLLEDIYNNMQN